MVSGWEKSGNGVGPDSAWLWRASLCPSPQESSSGAWQAYVHRPSLIATKWWSCACLAALGLPQCQDPRHHSRASAALPSVVTSSWLGAKQSDPGGDRDERGVGVGGGGYQGEKQTPHLLEWRVQIGSAERCPSRSRF